jgi:hypothetical protein
VFVLGKVVVRTSIVAVVLFASGLLTLARPAAAADTMTQDIPFVGCKADGQVGPLPAPPMPIRMPFVPKAVANRLAYYEAQNTPGIVAPRGWSCFGYYGSSGGSLILQPGVTPVHDDLLNQSPIKRYGIEIESSVSDTSGRFDVASVIARLFPTHKDFLGKVEGEGIMPSRDFPEGPFPADILTQYNDNDMSFETPANTIGLGTEQFWFKKNNQPIFGEISLVDEGDLKIAMRLPPQDQALVPVILDVMRSTVLATGAL